jgi:hypothetical protein
MSTIFNRLYQNYELEGISMPYTIEDFRRDAARKILEELSPEERHEIAKRLPPEERLRGLSPEERLRGLSEEEIEAYLKKLREQPTKRKAAKRRRTNGRGPKTKS